MTEAPARPAAEPLDLEALRKVAQAAEQDPRMWHWHPTGLVPERMATLLLIGSHNHTPCLSHENAQHIHSFQPAVALALLDELERLRGYLEAEQRVHNEQVPKYHAQIYELRDKLAARDAALLECVTVMERARKLALEHSDFRLWAMDPYFDAIQSARQLLGAASAERK